eukprot:comp9601_c0_seq1/m.4619 comp9601_c0_seq1/g.4619  ORF comp9601_c0_seq1/g.4619 comp9601_c0_seq1/m.4619 type:complete len:138 (-) comp9601_c0_seq1:459-872(-)
MDATRTISQESASIPSNSPPSSPTSRRTRSRKEKQMSGPLRALKYTALAGVACGTACVTVVVVATIVLLLFAFLSAAFGVFVAKNCVVKAWSVGANLAKPLLQQLEDMANLKNLSLEGTLPIAKLVIAATASKKKVQ